MVYYEFLDFTSFYIMSSTPSQITKGVRYDPLTSRDTAIIRNLDETLSICELDLVFSHNMNHYIRRYDDAVDILVRIIGHNKLIFAIFAFFILDFNKDSYLHLIYKYALNIKKE